MYLSGCCLPGLLPWLERDFCPVLDILDVLVVFLLTISHSIGVKSLEDIVGHFAFDFLLQVVFGTHFQVKEIFVQLVSVGFFFDSVGLFSDSVVFCFVVDSELLYVEVVFDS